MIKDISSLAKALVRKVRTALALAPAPSLPRPRLDGRRGYGDGGIKQPD